MRAPLGPRPERQSCGEVRQTPLQVISGYQPRPPSHKGGSANKIRFVQQYIPSISVGSSHLVTHTALSFRAQAEFAAARAKWYGQVVRSHHVHSRTERDMKCNSVKESAPLAFLGGAVVREVKE
jgi:hypothetical protein